MIGAGIMGCSVAYELARDGLCVRVLERSVPGAEASSAAAGILAPAMECHDVGAGAGLHLGLRSREMHAELSDALSERGLDTGFVRSSLLRVAFGEHDGRLAEQTEQAEQVQLDDLTAHHALLEGAAVPSALLDGEEARALEPNLSPRVTGALHLPDAAQVRPKRLLKALSLSAEADGAVFQSDTIVREVILEGGRAVGVDAGGERLTAGAVVVAAGSWTNLVPGLALPPKTIFPVKGQVMRTETRPPVLRHLVFGAGGYLVPRLDGELLVGATTEAVGFQRGVTFDGLSQLLDIGRAVVPRLGGARVLGHWAGFRPGTPDQLPLIGPLSHRAAGLYLASGHYRNGILLAPITGRLIADAVMDRAPTYAKPEHVTAVAPARLLSEGIV